MRTLRLDAQVLRTRWADGLKSRVRARALASLSKGSTAPTKRNGSRARPTRTTQSSTESVDEVASSSGHVAPVSIRVNPNVDPQTHPYISTGLKGNKFGIAHERTLAVYQRAAALPSPPA